MNREISKKSKNIIETDSSFEKDISEINNNFRNKLSHNLDFKSESQKKIQKKDKSQYNFESKYFEEADIEEIYEMINEINQAVTIDVNVTNTNDYYRNNKRSHSAQKITYTNEDHYNECQEIISILKKPLLQINNKDVKIKEINETPFKPLLMPKKVSLEGKVLFGNTSNDFSTDGSFKKNNNNSNNNSILIESQ